MDDYIRRQAAIDAIKTWGLIDGLSEGQAIEILADKEKLHAADVAPVVHGKWIPHSEKSREYIGTVLVHVMYDYWLCDTCGYRVENGQPMYNFCPNCGAKMDGGESDG